MPTHREIYAGHAADYERLVSREDYEGNILQAIEGLVTLDGLDVVDLGAGTGRLAGLLARHVRSVLALDVSVHMLRFARGKLISSAGGRPMVAAGDHSRMPLQENSVDLLVSGWSVSYVAVWSGEAWRAALEGWLAEARRVLRPGGHVILFESLGTGNESPRPLPHLEGFYGWLDETGFSQEWIRTDYRFESKEIADELALFFFGEEIRSMIRGDDPITLPECTGVWWRRF